MKKVININFQGRVIPIEDSAYDILKQYVDSLRKFFAKEEGGDEIINDIEGRIAELFSESLKKVYEGIYGDSSFEKTDPRAREVATDIVFNVGEGGFKKYPKFMEAMNQNDFEKMKQECASSYTNPQGQRVILTTRHQFRKDLLKQ